jgi:hypothetical protein
LALLGIAIFSALIYWFGLTQPYHLADLYQQPLLDLRKLTEGYPERLWPLVIEFVALFALYLAAWQIARRTSTRSLWFIVIGGAIVFGLILLFMYPYDAADLFDYIMYGRIINVYQANPFREVAAQFPNDPFYPYVGWRNAIAAYGPGWVITTALGGRLAGDGVLTNIIVFKAILALLLAGCIAILSPPCACSHFAGRRVVSLESGGALRNDRAGAQRRGDVVLDAAGGVAAAEETLHADDRCPAAGCVVQVHPRVVRSGSAGDRTARARRHPIAPALPRRHGYRFKRARRVGLRAVLERRRDVEHHAPHTALYHLAAGRGV